MDLEEFKKEFVCGELQISESYGKVFSFIDFANVNRWFENDEQDWNNKLLIGENLVIDLQKLKIFADLFSERARIYYGEDPRNEKSLGFTYATRKIFGKRDALTKDIQKIKRCVLEENKYVEIRKCNFDVEISVDATRMIEHFDTFCIFSGHADFVYLNNYLRKKGKKIIIIKGGYITAKLRESADLVINAQNIKKHITKIIKQKPD